MAVPAPDPARAADVAEFIELLNELRVWAGSPSYRALARTVGPRLRPPQALSQSTVGDLFQARRRRLNLELVGETTRALGLDAAGVARWRAACIRVHAEAKNGGPTGVLRQLPADLATFTGREADLAGLERTVAAHGEGGGARTVLISAIEGMGGIGKTQLAIRVAHRLVETGRYKDVQLFVNLRGFDAEQEPADPCEILSAFLLALGVPARRIPAGLDERAAMFRDQIHDRQALIVLDNAASEQQVRSLIPGGPNSLVIVTSRRSLAGLDGVEPHRLGLFSPSETLALLTRIAGAERVAAEPAAATRIGELCGHLPLAVALVAARLRSRPAWRLSDLVGELHRAGLRGLRIGGRDVSAILDLSYAGLTQPVQCAFRLMSLHPGDEFSSASAAALSGLSTHEAYEVLELLLDEHLLQQPVIGRYRFHDLVRLHARQLASEDPETVRSAALLRLMDHYRQAASAAMDVLIPYERARRPEVPMASALEPMTFHDAAGAEAWVEAELPNVVQAADATADSFGGHVGDLSAILGRFLEVRGMQRAALVLHSRAAEAMRGLPASERQADAIRHLAGTYWRLGQFQEAIKHSERALIHYEASGNLVGLGVTSGNLGLIALHQGSTLRALGLFRRSQTLFAQAGDQVGEARASYCIANVHRRRGRYAESIAWNDRAVELARQTAAHSDAVGSALCNRGITRMRQGDYDGARKDLLEARAVLNEGGDQADADEVLTDLGILHLRLDQPEQALANLRQSLTSSRDHGHQAAEGWALIGLSELHHTARNHPEARGLARDALTLAETIGEHAIKTHAHNHLGRADAALGDLTAAAEHHRVAFDLARAGGDVYQRAKALEGLAEVHYLNKEPDLAAETQARALRTYRRIGVPEAEGNAVTSPRRV
ncbi:tetratricopeptide (TPR) repeat protein [Catenulispora sp. GAS73]|uniref:tetratricopeptide repeat protein n=1 Tax=Catenulispora sp. GAS73 TaxID=3156269 RepID=UPI0035113037